MTKMTNRPGRERISLKASMKDARVDFDKRVIRGFSVITEGEALGHDLWIDGEFLAQAAAAGMDAKRGTKSRFTHPGLCNDGLGKFLGRAKVMRIDDNIVRADLHISDMADKSPEGKLGTYILEMADKEPDMFGASIVFDHDRGAESRFHVEHEDEDGEFISPDPLNERNLPHARLAGLVSVDIVDSPAANPGGFFGDTQEMAALGEVACRYVFGIDETAPPADIFGGLEPERAREFIAQFLARNALSISGETPATTQGGQIMADKVTIDPKHALSELRNAFPDNLELAVNAFERGLSVAEAKAEGYDALTVKIAAVEAKLSDVIEAKDAEIAKLSAENADIKASLLAGAKAVEHVEAPQAFTKERAIAEAKAAAKANGTQYAAEYSKMLEAHPELNV